MYPHFIMPIVYVTQYEGAHQNSYTIQLMCLVVVVVVVVVVGRGASLGGGGGGGG